MRRLNIRKVIEKNPRVDAVELAKGRELLQILQKNGVPRSAYRLAPPFARRRIQVGEDAGEDPRTVHLWP